jgi:regulatory protein
MVDELSRCRTRALNLLARREHTELELQRKLITKDFSEAIVAQVIESLIDKNFLSDLRFTELYVEQRARIGYGPLRIQQELQQRGVKAEVMEPALKFQQDEWVPNAHKAWQKYMRLHPEAELAKQQKFLLYRGYSYDQMKAAIEIKKE